MCRIDGRTGVINGLFIVVRACIGFLFEKKFFFRKILFSKVYYGRFTTKKIDFAIQNSAGI